MPDQSIIIPLTQGKTAIVDAQDYSLICGYTWCASYTDGHWYATAHIPGSGHKSRRILLHRLLMDASPHVLVDHINRNGLDCRRENMRFATTGQNNANARKRIGCQSPYKGVSWQSRLGKWRAEAAKDGERISGGCFEREQDAARAYDLIALALWGAYALTNYPASGYTTAEIHFFHEQCMARKRGKYAARERT